MFQFGSGCLVSVIFGSGSSVSNHFFASLSAPMYPPFLIFNYVFRFVISDSKNHVKNNSKLRLYAIKSTDIGHTQIVGTAKIVGACYVIR